MSDEEPADRDDDSDSTPELELDAVYDAIDAVGRPHLTATESLATRI